MTEYRPPTDMEVDEMVSTAYAYGFDGWRHDRETHTTDWEAIMRGFEVGGIDLGNDDDSPVIRRIRASYRRGKKDADE